MQVLNSGKESLGLVDAWTIKDQTHPGFTWRRKKGQNEILSERLDYFLLENSIAQYVYDVKVWPGYRSDHSLVLLELKFHVANRGPGYWKFNTSLLRNVDFIEKMNKLIDVELAQRQCYHNIKDHWEIMKLTIRSSILQFSAHRKKSVNNQLEVLERKLGYWQKERDTGYFQKVEERIVEIQREIKSLQNEKTRGAMLRCRADWTNLAEKLTKYFLNLEKTNFNRKTIYRIKTNRGETTDQKEIGRNMTQFYKNLYTSKMEPDLDYIKQVEMESLDEVLCQRLERDISTFEIGLALKALSSNKTPGIDGLPPEFYKMFWMKLKHYFTELFNEIIHDGIFHRSARQGIITLIEKVVKDPLLIENWRPISLLCADYKIYAKLVANRLQETLEKLIHPSQTGFIKGRNIAINLMKIQTMIEYCNSRQESAILISFDFQKAFDNVEWGAIFQVLEKLGFGEYFQKLVKVLFKDPVSCVMNNGYWNGFFELQKSTHQGDPASALIFLLVVEALCCSLRNNVRIKGLQMFNFTMKTLQYADDLCVIIKPDRESFDQIFLELEKFYRFSGLKINLTKTIAKKFGPCSDTEAKFYTLKPIMWTDEAVKILGVSFHHNMNMMYKLNFTDKLEKAKAILQVWSARQLTLMGKIVIVNTLLVSQFTYQLASVPTSPENFFKEFKRIILSFIWEERPHRVRYEKLIQSYEQGGLKLVDLDFKEQALKAKWPIKFQEQDYTFIYGFLPLKDHRIWMCNIEGKHIRQMVKEAGLARDIWLAWSKVFFTIPETMEGIQGQVIWGNSLVLRAGLPFFDTALINSNIDYPQTLFENGSFKTYEQIPEEVRKDVDLWLFNAIKTVIPPVWRSFLRESNANKNKSVKWEMYKGFKSPSRFFYWELTDKKKGNDASKLKWEKEFGEEIPDEVWNSVFTDIFKYTNATKLREFHYKIINQILTTNILRSKFSNVTNKCVFCQESKETIMHLFIECKKVKRLWKTLVKWIDYFANERIQMTPMQIILKLRYFFGLSLHLCTRKIEKV